MNVESDGPGKMSRQLRELARSVEKLEQENKVPLRELLDSRFVNEYTDFESFDEMVARSGWEIDSHEDLEAIPERELDIFVRKHSVFSSCEEMIQIAGKEWVATQLGV